MNQELAQLYQDIEYWIKNFVEIPHPALGGWAPCPFARRARLDRDFEVRVGQQPLSDLAQLALTGLNNRSVIIIAYDPEIFAYEQFHSALEHANTQHLLPNDLIVLEDHPAATEIVNGISMNQGTYELSMVQSLSKLNTAAAQMGKKGFYHTWPEEYLQMLFRHRVDPR
jgi:hypothetical protein